MQKVTKVSLVQRIIERIWGKKFYIAIVGTKGSDTYYINSTLYRSKQEVIDYRDHVVADLPSLVFVGYYSFRSHNDFRFTQENTRRINPVD